MAKADFSKREKIANLLINSVTLYTEKAVVKGNVPVIRGDVLNLSNVASSFFYISSIVHARPHAGNANCGLQEHMLHEVLTKKTAITWVTHFTH
jgi:hypothetical protein